jgi:HTH-type transcriptional regulator/antitoxin MqsA
MTDGYRCLCGSRGELVTAPREITIGHWSVNVDDTFIRCPACGEEWYLPGQMDASQKKAAALIREKHHLMSPDRIRALRLRMGLSQPALEQLLGVGPKTVTRWEKGTVVPGAPVSRLLEVIENSPGVVAKLAWARAFNNLAKPPDHVTENQWGALIEVRYSLKLPNVTPSITPSTNVSVMVGASIRAALENPTFQTRSIEEPEEAVA